MQPITAQINSNPLQQYFRRPVIYFKLPSDIKYPPEVVQLPENGELPVYAPTAIDTISSNTPDELYNGIAIHDIIKSCIPAIKNPWMITSVDLDAVLIAIKIADQGNELEVDTQCPSCEEYTKFGINLLNMMSQLGTGDYNTELVHNDLTLKFRPLVFKEMQEVSIAQFQFQKRFNEINDPDTKLSIEEKTKLSKQALKEITEVTMQTLSISIEYIKTPTAYVNDKRHILEFLKNCDKHSYTKLRDHNTSLKEKSEIKPIKLTCIHCQHEYSQPFSLNISDFFE